MTYHLTAKVVIDIDSDIPDEEVELLGGPEDYEKFTENAWKSRLQSEVVDTSRANSVYITSVAVLKEVQDD